MAEELITVVTEAQRCVIYYKVSLMWWSRQINFHVWPSPVVLIDILRWLRYSPKGYLPRFTDNGCHWFAIGRIWYGVLPIKWPALGQKKKQIYRYIPCIKKYARHWICDEKRYMSRIKSTTSIYIYRKYFSPFICLALWTMGSSDLVISPIFSKWNIIILVNLCMIYSTLT